MNRGFPDNRALRDQFSQRKGCNCWVEESRDRGGSPAAWTMPEFPARFMAAMMEGISVAAVSLCFSEAAYMKAVKVLRVQNSTSKWASRERRPATSRSWSWDPPAPSLPQSSVSMPKLRGPSPFMHAPYRQGLGLRGTSIAPCSSRKPFRPRSRLR